MSRGGDGGEGGGEVGGDGGGNGEVCVIASTNLTGALPLSPSHASANQSGSAAVSTTSSMRSSRAICSSKIAILTRCSKRRLA